jgi:hypothetical protein
MGSDYKNGPNDASGIIWALGTFPFFSSGFLHTNQMISIIYSFYLRFGGTGKDKVGRVESGMQIDTQPLQVKR